MTYENLLLVEGKDDENVVGHICLKTRTTITSFKLQPAVIERKVDGVKIKEEGIDVLLRLLPIEIKNRDGSKTLACIVDADDAIAARWQQIAHILQAAGYQDLPASFENGLILPPTNILPKFGLWIMPDNQLAGKLEDFLRYLIPVGDDLIDEVEIALNRLEHSVPSKRRYREVDRPKVFMHTWLAWQEKSGLPYGSAIKATFLTTNHELCARFVAWLNALFNA